MKTNFNEMKLFYYGYVFDYIIFILCEISVKRNNTRQSEGKKRTEMTVEILV